MLCPTCQSEIEADAEACFTCGMAVFALTQGTVLAGRYEIVRPLGRGGMGRVYMARDRIMEENVALKVLRSEFMRDPEMSRRFVSEIKLARKIGHRNVCRIHEYGEDGDARFIVMELIDGVTLKEFLRSGPPPPDAAYDLAIQVARGLNAVHELGIVHRDFKAANIMIDAQGVAKLVDFGIAKDLSSDVTGPTVAGLLMGTPEYMSPEQVRGAPVGFRSDIYALGCVVYEIFTGHAPFRGATPVATVFKHLHEELPVEGEDAALLPAAVVPVLRRALAKDPALRFESVADFAEALSKASAEGGFTVPPRGGLRLPAARRPPEAQGSDTATIAPLRRRRVWTWALAAAALAAATVLGIAYRAFFGPAPSAPPSMAVGAPSPGEAAVAGPDDTAPTPFAAASAMPSAPPSPSSAEEGAAPSPRAASARPPSPPPSPRPAAVTGILRLLVVPEARVSIDGTSLGAVSRREIALAPGTHTVRFEHPDYQPLQRRVTIREGDTESLVMDLAEKGIRRN
jgi:predicted Ser/Thr protein kinase